MSLRMLRIQARRTGALWLLLLAPAAVWYVAEEPKFGDVTLWPRAMAYIRYSVALVGPLAAGWAAWLGGRDRAHGLTELLATVPRPAPVHDLTRWTAAALWVGTAYLLGAALVMGDTWREATWGGPTWRPVQLGVLTVLACSALGFAAGAWRPGRFTPPLMAVGTFLALVGPSNILAPYGIRYLTLAFEVAPDVFFAVQPDLGREHSTWLLGLTTAALAAVALRRTRAAAAWGALGVGVAAAGVGAALLLQTSPVPPEARTAIPYTPVCTEGRVPVCMHPAYETHLPKAAALVDRLTEPLAGIPGLPALLWPSSHPPRPGLPADTVRFYLGYGWDEGFEARQIALALVGAEPCDGSAPLPPDGATSTSEPVRQIESSPDTMRGAVAAWLLQEAGVDRAWWGLTEEVRPAFERFVALDPAARRAWLAEHLAGLRACQVGVDALP